MLTRSSHRVPDVDNRGQFPRDVPREKSWVYLTPELAGSFLRIGPFEDFRGDAIAVVDHHGLDYHIHLTSMGAFRSNASQKSRFHVHPSRE